MGNFDTVMKTGFRTLGFAVASLLVLFGTQGCETMGGWRAREEMRQREDMLIIQDDYRKLEGRLEGIDVEMARLERSVETLRDSQTRDTAAQLQKMQARLDELEARIARVDAAREKDKKELVDRLSSQIAEIMSRSAASRSASTTGRRTTDRRTSNTGYEHEVKPGESLSAIAAAYGVSVQTILDHNDIKDAHRIRVGQKLFIPE